MLTLKDSDYEYTPLTRSPRVRGRGRGAGRGLPISSPARRGHVQTVAVDTQLQADDDVVTVNSVKLGKRSALHCWYSWAVYRGKWRKLKMLCNHKGKVWVSECFYALHLSGALSDTAIHPSVCPSPRRAAALGCRHAGCLQLSHMWIVDPSTDRRRSITCQTAIGGSISSHRPPGLVLHCSPESFWPKGCSTNFSVDAS